MSSPTSPTSKLQPASGAPARTTLHSVGDIRHYFANNPRRYYFISASNFNMIGMHLWVRGWYNINMLDCFDGKHPASTIVPDNQSRPLSGIEDVNHYLLDNPKVHDLLSETPMRKRVFGRPDQALFLFFDSALEERCRALGLEVALPPNHLVREVDSKITTTEIGNAAGVMSVPNVLARVGSYAELQSIAQAANLGERWVVQSAYGDSGKTTYFIASEADYDRVAHEIESQDKVKVMRWVRCVGTAIEACATRWGTVVGPLLTELIGQEALTPYAGGWCGNENYTAAFSPAMRAQIQQKTEAFGRALYARGYRGTFELDYLIDLDTQEVYLGELNSRITGITALTNTSEFSETQLPLFLFHLLEFDAQVDLQLDIAQFNHDMLHKGAMGTSAQLILKYTEPTLQVIEDAPVSGVYVLREQGLRLIQASTNRRDALSPNEVYVLRIQNKGEYAYKGGDMAIVFLNVPVRDAEGQLNARGLAWAEALRKAFSLRPLTQEERSAVELAHNPANVKSARGQ